MNFSLTGSYVTDRLANYDNRFLTETDINVIVSPLYESIEALGKANHKPEHHQNVVEVAFWMKMLLDVLKTKKLKGSENSLLIFRLVLSLAKDRIEQMEDLIVKINARCVKTPLRGYITVDERELFHKVIMSYLDMLPYATKGDLAKAYQTFLSVLRHRPEKTPQFDMYRIAYVNKPK